MSKLDITGERLVPGIFGKIATEHLHRYAIAIHLIKGKKVLDIASGEGYGSSLLAQYSSEVWGVDISNEAIVHAKEKYKASNLVFKQGSILEIPFAENTFDVVVSFETLEHVFDHQKVISELKRVLKPDGILILSTPDKSIYSDQANYTNPYHEKELYEEEFLSLVNQEFNVHKLLYQKYLTGSLIIESKREGGFLKLLSGDFNQLNLEAKMNQEYMIAICSNQNIELKNFTSIFNDDTLINNWIAETLDQRIRKIKSGFRYRMADIFFSPWDFIKSVAKKTLKK